MNFSTQHDPARIARAVRSLAHDTHATLKQAPTRDSLEKLTVRIERLRSDLGDQREAPVGIWLTHLDRKVKSASRQRAREERTPCGCG